MQGISMEKKAKFKISLSNIFYTFMIIAVSIICVGGASPYPHAIRFPLIIATAILSAGFIIFKQQKIYLNMPVVLLLLTVAYLFISVTYSVDSKNTMELAIVYLCSTVITLADFKLDFYKKALTAMKVVCIVIAFSIIVSSFVDDCMIKYFSFIVNPTHNSELTRLIHQEISWSKSYSGFAKEKGEAAFIMNVGIAIYYAKYFSEKKFKISDIFFLAILFWALILANKRMLFICPIAVLLFLLIFSTKKGRLIKMLPFIFLAVCALIMAVGTIPQITYLFERFSNSDSMESLSGRVNIWPYSLEMFGKNPLFGMGIGSFNKYLSTQGITINGDEWSFYGHNVYYEFLGELGIVGCLLLFGALIMIFVKTTTLMRDKNISSFEKYLLTFSFAIQLTCFIYSASGNVLLYKQQIFIWFFASAIALTISRKYRKSTKTVKELAYA